MKSTIIMIIIVFCLTMLYCQVNLTIVDEDENNNTYNLKNKLYSRFSKDNNFTINFLKDEAGLKLLINTLTCNDTKKNKQQIIIYSYVMNLRSDSGDIYYLFHGNGFYKNTYLNNTVEKIYQEVINKLNKKNINNLLNLNKFSENCIAIKQELQEIANQVLNYFRKPVAEGGAENDLFNVNQADLLKFIGLTDVYNSKKTKNGEYRLIYYKKDLIVIKGKGNVQKNGFYPIATVAITLTSGSIGITTETGVDF